MEGGYRLLSGECNMQLIGRTTQIITVDILYGLPIYPAVLFGARFLRSLISQLILIQLKSASQKQAEILISFLTR